MVPAGNSEVRGHPTLDKKWMLPVTVLINEKGSPGLSQILERMIVNQCVPWASKAQVDRICLFSENELHFLFIIFYFSENELYKISFNLLAFIF